MWECIFDAVTNRGLRCNDPGGPKAGEYAIRIHSSQCGWFNSTPERYMWDGEKLAEWPGWADEQFEKVKSIVWGTIKAERDRRQDGGFKVGEKWFHSDQSSRLQHLGLKDEARDILTNGGTMESQLLIAGQAVFWKTMDGTFVPLTVQTVYDIVTAGKTLDAALFTRAEQHRAAMEASPDPSGYDFSTGWPEAYGL